ncbi:alpha/beta hydrolase family esterase [Variovorax sp. HJSM1_2]|uniref:extracellular catalytic domain type 1 short-chain-length polyhydroxyalkanoate depolymerase n=1 Tax=Variovorax sp. HJSM1_2 TaxID=3366263 RepID=UPI003BD8EEA3
MTKSLSSLWLKSFTKINKAQQRQGRRLLQSLFAPPMLRTATAVAKSVAKAAASASLPTPVAKSKAKRIRPVAPTRPARVATRPAALAGSGRWMRSYYQARAEGGSGVPRRMDYWLFLPDRPLAQAQAPMPLVVMLHGCTQDAVAFAQGTRMNALAQREGFAVLYPQQSISIDRNRCWHWHQRATQAGGGEVPWVVGAVRKVLAGQPIDRSRIYLAGMSAGAALANIIALRYPEYVAAVGLHSSPVYGTVDSRLGAFSAMQHGSSHSLSEAVREMATRADFPGMPAIILHGQDDKVVRAINLGQLTQQFCWLNKVDPSAAPLAEQSFEARPTGRAPRHAYEVKDYGRSRKALVRVCRIEGLDHAWSGGDASLPFNAAPGPDASQLIWNFFRMHRRALAATPLTA